ncbi:MAG: SGNH/GDSL hydrolase family protein [Limisphaerales bacterium]
MTDPTPARGSRKIWFVLLAAGVPTLIGLVAVAALMIHQQRVVIRTNPFSITFQKPPIYVEEPDHEVSGQRYLFDPVLGWRNIPHFEASTFGYPLSINSKGLRDREYPYEKPAGVKRILVLGDSFAWGYGVGDEHIFTEVLEEKLAGGEQKWDVINAGVSGYGTDQEYLFLKNEGLKYQPDVVLLAFYLRNDPVNNTGLVQYGLGKPCFTKGDLSEFVPPHLNPGTNYLQAEGLEPLQVTIRLVKGIDDLCTANNARMILMTFGGFGEPNPENAAAVRWISEQLLFQLRVQLDTDLVNVGIDEAFTANGVTPNEVFEGNRDRHWNPHGHKLVGEILHDFLKDQL